VADRERVIVTDFRAPAADPSLGSTVTEAVRTDLGQSGALLIMSPNDVASALTRMQRPESTHVDLSLAREIAAREGVKGIVDGDLALSRRLRMTVRFVDTPMGGSNVYEAIRRPELIPPWTRSLASCAARSRVASLGARQPTTDRVTTLSTLRKRGGGRRGTTTRTTWSRSPC
jgi:hypothetical protein